MFPITDIYYVINSVVYIHVEAIVLMIRKNVDI